MTYAELQAEVIKYLKRTDLTTQAPTFIALAEAYLFRELAVNELQVIATGTTTGGYATLPADFDSVSKLTVTIDGREFALDFISTVAGDDRANSTPWTYSYENNKLRIWGSSDSQAYKLYYKPKILPLSDSNTTNWLLENAQDLYLYASCLQGSMYVRNDMETQNLKQIVLPLLESVRSYIGRRGMPMSGMQIKTRNGGASWIRS